MAGLNNNHRRYLHVSCQHIDRHLSNIEAMLENPAGAAFPRYVDDLAPTQKRVVRDYIARIRERLRALLEQFEMQPEPATTPVSWGARTTLLSICNTLEDMNPRQLRGYGDLDEATAQRLQATVAEIDQPIARLLAYLGQHHGRDPQERLASLEASGRLPSAALKTLERIISTHGLVEFRPTLESILDHLETTCFEIAVFGRVSSGKSSLLNRIIGAPVLPVGVTPITAVPTRITAGATPTAVVRSAEGKAREIPLEALPSFASEEGNPGSRRHVTELLVRMPSPRLREGFVFIDTPGIGSLASQGEAEALAYLPRCDLGIVLLDSAAALNQEDLGLLRLLYEAGIPAMVLLSKCDLLSADDQARMSRYIEEQLRHHAGLSLPVHPVSTVGPDEALLDRWFAQQIQPLYEQQQALVRRAIHRKTGALLESVRAALTARVSKSPGSGRLSPEESEALDEAVHQAARRLEESRARRVSADLLAQEEAMLSEIAAAIAGRQARRTRPPRRWEEDARELVMQWLDVKGRSIAAEVGELRSELAKSLATLREALMADREAEPPSLPQLFGLPAPDLGPLQLSSLPGPPAFPAWCAPLWRPFLQRHVQQLLRQPLHEVLTLHARRLQDWATAAVGQLAEAYQEQESTYREALRAPSRLTLEGANGGEDELRCGLQLLDQLVSRDGGAAREPPASGTALRTVL